MLKIGSKVQIGAEVHCGPKKTSERSRKGKVEKIYPNFVLVRIKEGYLECFKPYELEEIE